MANVYEFDGELFTNSGEFLDALSHEYKSGDKDLVIQTLEDYGFSIGDISTGSEGPNLVGADENASA